MNKNLLGSILNVHSIYGNKIFNIYYHSITPPVYPWKTFSKIEFTEQENNIELIFDNLEKKYGATVVNEIMFKICGANPVGAPFRRF